MCVCARARALSPDLTFRWTPLLSVWLVMLGQRDHRFCMDGSERRQGGQGGAEKEEGISYQPVQQPLWSPVLPPGSYSVLTSGFSDSFLICPRQSLMSYLHLTALANTDPEGSRFNRAGKQGAWEQRNSLVICGHLSCLKPDTWTYFISFILMATQQSRQGLPGQLGSLCTAQRLLTVMVSSQEVARMKIVPQAF